MSVLFIIIYLMKCINQFIHFPKPKKSSTAKMYII